MNVRIVLGLSLALLGCAGSPDPVFYALSSRSGPTVSSPPLKIELRSPGLPGYLDRPHIVRRVTAERLGLAADERWGAPLDAMAGATLADDLSERLPGCVVYTETGALSATADVRIEVAVSRFELTASGSVELTAEVAVRWTDPDATRLKRYALRIRPATRTTPDLVGSMSGLLGQLADAIAAAIGEGRPALADRPVSSSEPPEPPLLPVAPGAVPRQSP